MWSSIWIKRLPGHSLHTGEAEPGPAGKKGSQAAEGAAAAGPQTALQPGHLRTAHQGGAEEAGGGTSGGGEHQGAVVLTKHIMKSVKKKQTIVGQCRCSRSVYMWTKRCNGCVYWLTLVYAT